MGDKYNLKTILNKNYLDCKSTLKLTSLDDNHTNVEYYLCHDEKLDVFDFDEIKDKMDKDKKSPDAIYIKEKTIYIVEFKNQDPCDISCIDLREKFTFAIKFFNDTIQNIKDYSFIICLVYKNQGNHKQSQRYKQGIGKRACCTLEDTNKNEYNNFYSYIITQDTNFYKTNFKELKC